MSTATRLRRHDESLEIVVLERGEHVSFANCGLPYYVGGVIPDREDLLLQTPESLRSRFDLDVRVRHEVIALNRKRRMVTVLDRVSGAHYEESYDALVLATGATPMRLDVPGGEQALTLRDVSDVDRITDAIGIRSSTAVVVGAGFIGLEMAENLSRSGLAVTLVEVGNQVLAPLDPEMAQQVADHLAEKGVSLRTGVFVTRMDRGKVELSDGGMIAGDVVVAALGVRPESSLALSAGLAVGERGGIVVDSQQRTSDPRVFAVGDVAEKRDLVSGERVLVPLAQAANRHGRLVADVIASRDVSSAPVAGTAIVGVFGLTVAITGWSEKRLRAARRPMRVIHTHPGSHASYYPGAERLSLKLIVDPETDEILGAQAVGRQGVDKRIDVIATAMRSGLRAAQLADLDLAYAPAYGSAKDPVNMLGFVAENLAGGEKSIQWHELAAAVAEGAVVVDVRSRRELAAGVIPGAVNIPLDELRHRLSELPTGPLVVHCEVGVRGHTAARLLGQAGWDVANLDGGYVTWLHGTRSRPR
jgi:NADPH-dependent 2,4-dienoyl-CoA reductase/sulfur reductase-like enzyme/rhodanese-related sulfurtransferase